MVKIGKYKIRLLNRDDLIDSLGYEINGNATDLRFNISDNTPEWVAINGKHYWGMDFIDDCNWNTILEISNILSRGTDDEDLYVRPVINLKKCAIEGGCKNEEFDYSIGQNLSYNNEDYCVIKNSTVSDDYVTLIKQEPLTFDELVTNKGNLSTDYFQNSNGIGLSNYYKSDTCYNSNRTGCNTNYDLSFVKTIVNNWSNAIINDLKEIDGYKSRLINADELINLEYERQQKGTGSGDWVFFSNTDSMCPTDYQGWSMTSNTDSNYTVYTYGNIENFNSRTAIYANNVIRPVINLKKCALTNTCE